MGTRCLTVFKNLQDKEIAVLYRQYDGYLSGHGLELANFLKNKKIVNGIQDENKNLFNGMECLTAQVVEHFKTKPGGFYLYPTGTRNLWEDYIYIVSGEIGKEPNIKVDSFEGAASEYQNWLDKQEN